MNTIDSLRDEVAALEAENAHLRHRGRGAQEALEYTRANMEAGYRTGSAHWDEWYEKVCAALGKNPHSS